MTTRQATRILGPVGALIALALTLVAVGLLLTGSAAASSSAARATATPPVTSGPAKRAIVQFGSDVTVPAGERVEAVVAAGGNVTLDGIVTGSVVVFGGDVLVRGTVEDSVVCFGGNVRLAPTASVGSAMSTRDKSIILFGGTLIRDQGSQVTGGVQSVDNANWAGSLAWVTQHTVIRPWWGFTLVGWIVQTAFFLVLALIAAALMPRQLRAVQRNLRLKPAGSLGWGALTFFIVGPAVLVVLVISIVGLLVVIPYVLLTMLAYFFATTAVAAFVAQRVLAGSGQNDNLMLATTLGVIGTTIVSRIPVLGPLVIVAMILFGTGAGVLAIVEWRRTRKLVGASAGIAIPAPEAAGASFVASPGEPMTDVRAGGPATPAATEPATAVTAQLTAGVADEIPPPVEAAAANVAEPPATAEPPAVEEPPATAEPPAET